jgi:hypothetical protein
MTMQGTIVDATWIAAPSSTKNKEGKRDPEMHQTKTGNQWYFGMNVHAGVDKDSGLDPFGGRHRRERARPDTGSCAVAWRGEGRLSGCWIPGHRQQA